MRHYDPAFAAELNRMLTAGGIEDAGFEVRCILEDTDSEAQARAVAKRRLQHEPLQYLLGRWEFYGLPVYVGEGVLIPRADTETLVDAVLSRLRNVPAPQIVDLCTGSGCIALALRSQRRDAAVTGIEKDTDAMKYACKNVAALGLDVPMDQADVLSEETAARYRALDAVVSNPPYLSAEDMTHLQAEVTHEPALALDGGADGLHFYREITRIWKHALKPGGLLAYEVGIGQAESVADILKQHGFGGIECLCDLNGVARVVLGRYRISDLTTL